MEFKPAKNIPYTRETWEEYKNRLAAILREKALDGDQIFKDPETKNYIVSYMESELLSEKKENERLILGTNIRLVHMEIETSTGKRVFPIVNEYKGHHLMKTFYFYKREDGSCDMACVEVKNTPSIIIP